MQNQADLPTRSRLVTLYASAAACGQAELFDKLFDDSPTHRPLPHWSVMQHRDVRGRFMASERTSDGLDTATAVAALSDPEQRCWFDSGGWGC